MELNAVFITEARTNRIRKIQANGIITTVAGNPDFGFLIDGLEVNLIVHDFP